MALSPGEHGLFLLHRRASARLAEVCDHYDSYASRTDSASEPIAGPTSCAAADSIIGIAPIELAHAGATLAPGNSLRAVMMFPH